MKLTLISSDHDLARIAVHGRITSQDFHCRQGKNPLEELLGPDWHTMAIILNLSDCPHADSSAVGWLIGTERATRSHGGLILHSVQSHVRKLLELLKVDKVLKIALDEEAAVHLVPHHV